MFKWRILELLTDAKGVKYSVSLENDTNIVKSEGYQYFKNGVVNIPISQIKESDLINWLVKDDIKLNLENQLNALKLSNNIEFPWIANTFTPES
jgi:hypothetical protein